MKLNIGRNEIKIRTEEIKKALTDGALGIEDMLNERKKRKNIRAGENNNSSPITNLKNN